MLFEYIRPRPVADYFIWLDYLRRFITLWDSPISGLTTWTNEIGASAVSWTDLHGPYELCALHGDGIFSFVYKRHFNHNADLSPRRLTTVLYAPVMGLIPYHLSSMTLIHSTSSCHKYTHCHIPWRRTRYVILIPTGSGLCCYSFALIHILFSFMNTSINYLLYVLVVYGIYVSINELRHVIIGRYWDFSTYLLDTC